MMSLWRSSKQVKQEALTPKEMSAVNLHGLFEVQAITHPQRIAVVCDSIEITYVELNQKANQLAHYLKDAGVVSNTLVAIQLPRSIELIIAFLAVLKAGGTYVPIDPSYPASRINFVLEDSHAAFLITHSALLGDFKQENIAVIPLVRHPERSEGSRKTGTVLKSEILRAKKRAQDDVPRALPISKHNSMNLDLPLSSQDLAYVIYTSGSTGQAKGVLVEHGNVVNATTASISAFSSEPIANLLLLLSVAFDGSFAGIYWTLSQGGKLVLPNETRFVEHSYINALIRDQKISDILCTPTIYRSYMAFIRDPDHNLSRIMVGGEICTEQLVVEHSQLFPEVSLVNIYGPTEATIWASFMTVYDKKTRKKTDKIGIGRAIDHVEIYILDQNLQLCGPGVEGEIYIGGKGIARGYLNQPELTAQHFITDPFNSTSRLYKTGDRGCYGTDGHIEYLGRVDNQIKILGHRIELEEIEAVLSTYATVSQVIVVAQTEENIPLHLVAYLSNEHKLDASQQQQCVAALQEYAQKNLPKYMVPTAYQFIDEFPLSPNGKIDRKQLSTLLKNAPQTHNVRPKTDIETQVHALWVETLPIKQIALGDNFFALGGHSLLAARIVAKVSEKLGKKTTVYALYQAPTLEQFAKIVEQAPPAETTNTLALEYPHVLPLHELQFIYWVTKFAEPKLRKYNVVDRKRIQGSVDKAALDAALQWVLHKQDVFSYHIHHFYPLQTPCTKPSKQFRQWITTSLQHLSDTETESYLSQRYADLFYKRFWRVNTPWIRANLYYLNNDQIELHVCMSHLIADERSMAIFFHELSNAYLFITQRSTLHNHDLLQNYKHYITHKNSTVQQHAHTDEHFWKHYLQDTGLFIVPTQYVVTNHAIAATHIPVSESFGLKLSQFCAQHRVGLNDVLCAATSLALFQCCNQDLSCVPHKLLISHLKSTRDEPQYDHVMGCFLRMDILKLSLNHQTTLVDLAKQAQQSAYETALFQRASSLIKIAAIGKQPKIKKPLITFFTNIGLTLIAKSFPKFQLNNSLINACKTLAAADRTQQFFINVNIHNDFLNETEQSLPADLLGLRKREIPLYAYPVRVIPYTLDIAFHRNNDQNMPFITIATNLLPDFQKKLGETLASIIIKEDSAALKPQDE